jgi:integrase
VKGSIRQRSKGSWALTFDAGRDANGKRRQKSVTVRGTKREAERELARLLNEVNTGTYVEPAKATVASYLERWLTSIQSSLQPRTFEVYHHFVHSHLIPHLGHVRLDQLNPLMIEEFKARALTSGRKDGGPLSNQSVNHLLSKLGQALEQAVAWGLLRANPVARVRLPPPNNKERKALTVEEVEKLLAVSQTTSWHHLVVLALATGARRGEVLGLTWADVNMETGAITICRSLEHTKAHGRRFKDPKTKAGRRLLILPPFALEVLREHRKEQFTRRQLLGEAYQDQGLIIAAEDGHPYQPNYISRKVKQLLQKAGLPDRCLHGLRHTCGSLLAKEGCGVKTLQAQLGHASATTTLNRYAHLLGGEQEHAAARLESVLSPALRQASPAVCEQNVSKGTGETSQG